MKHYRILILSGLLAATALLGACSKWLDVSPKTQMKEDEQFSNRQGFIDALFGVYQRTAADSLYGNNLSFGMIDILAGRYENKAGTGNWYGQLARYNYTFNASGLNVERETSEVWATAYAAIAQANFILRNVDDKKSMLGEQTYRIVKGESLALRAFLHFDLLRLYAPVPGAANNGQPAIPYMDAFTIQPRARQTVGEIVSRCEQELLAAEELLSVHTEIDQIAGNQNSVNPDLFLMFRQNHLNYWAVKALLARLYLYKSDKVNAFKYAQEVINSGKFRLMTSADLASTDPVSENSDLTLTREHVFSIYASQLKRVADDLFKQSPNTNNEDTRDLYNTQTKINTLYESSVPGYSTDIRLPIQAKSLWTVVNSLGNVYTKKYHADNQRNVRQRLIPVIRLPEMYYISAEAALTPEEGLVFLNAVRTARSLPELATAANLEAEIMKEYRKEFYAEGQLWYYFKRKNTTTIPDGVGNPMTATKYIFPLPLDEIQFGK
ncbi:RagB/SusD family nutrient uptake outer membrane protein [Chitinophaga barathri]|uniref:RagB/SusD family nutrient uptake outer membrane protein n=1 Tax=Chitinophaga barathri TaxID=1647451 RepID=A0A3N4MIW9_9BACT|nr:RagB/SusD family nutrient uptake outer membrane protein [Chitinophaga barathri]RPD39619.1 RagB/SusD family nutrient uptake outer membrane protein [Chitinophaga barathri]